MESPFAGEARQARAEAERLTRWPAAARLMTRYTEEFEAQDRAWMLGAAQSALDTAVPVDVVATRGTMTMTPTAVPAEVRVTRIAHECYPDGGEGVGYASGDERRIDGQVDLEGHIKWLHEGRAEWKALWCPFGGKALPQTLEQSRIASNGGKT